MGTNISAMHKAIMIYLGLQYLHDPVIENSVSYYSLYYITYSL